MYRLSKAAQWGARVLHCAAYGGLGWLAASSLYLLALLVAGRRPRARAAGAETVQGRVAVLVPAHNEQGAIGAAVASLSAQDHPGELLEVIVIADNCNDDTAALAASAGATVWERDAPAAPESGRAHV